MITFSPNIADKCSVLKAEINKGHGDGCQGAVYSDGSPSRQYCMNTKNESRFSWYADCCKWEDSQCVPKNSGKFTISFRNDFSMGIFLL